MLKEFEFSIQSTIFDRRRQLKINPAFISIDGRDTTDPPVIFPVADIEAFRYGIQWIKGTHFVIGRTYLLEIRSTGKRTIKIRLRSVYGIRSKLLGEKYIRILNALIETYFNDMAAHYTGLLDQGMSYELSGIPVSPEGILLNSKKGLVFWSRLQMNRYIFYFTLSDKNEPENYRMLYYEHDWNAAILLAVADYGMAKCRLQRRS